MDVHIQRGMMLDPGLTALALRGLHDQDAHYPFLDGFKRRGRRGRRAARVLEPVAQPAPPPSPSRWRRVVQWLHGSAAAPEPIASRPLR